MIIERIADKCSDMPYLLNITIVIPAYNEEKRIGETLEKIVKYMENKKHDYEIIVVDDGSCDGTINMADGFSQKNVRTLRNNRNRGKGYSVRHGMRNALKSFVLFSDADLSTPIEELENLTKPILTGEAQVAIGSRAITGAIIEIPQPLYRVAMGKIFNLLVRLIAIGGFNDTQCGFKLFTRQAAQEIFADNNSAALALTWRSLRLHVSWDSKLWKFLSAGSIQGKPRSTRFAIHPQCLLKFSRSAGTLSAGGIDSIPSGTMHSSGQGYDDHPPGQQVRSSERCCYKEAIFLSRYCHAG